MAQQVVMPKQGNSVESCIIVEWNVQVGDTVGVGDVLCSAETDKSTIEVESTADGVLLARLYEEGDEVPVMVPIAVVGKAGEEVPLAQELQQIPQQKAEQQGEVAVFAAAAAIASPEVGASPRARSLSQSRGVNLSSIPQGSGPKGRIIERDVRAMPTGSLTPLAKQQALSEGLVAPSVGSGIGGRVLASDLSTNQETISQSTPLVDDRTEIPVKGVRKVTARRMMESMHSTCQLTLHAYADARALKRLRQNFKKADEALGLGGITINDLILFAVSRTLKRFPAFNAHFLGDKIVQYSHVHLGMATDTPKGLLVPVLKNSDLLSLEAISKQGKALAGKCKQGTAQPDELTGSTFTVSNVGSYGIESFTPVLNIPEVAILGVGAITLKPVEDAEKGVVFIEQIGLSLTMDHQAVDGADAARFLRSLADAIAAIDVLLAL